MKKGVASHSRGRARQPRRKGAAIALVAISMTLLVGFAALAIDVGRLYVVRGQLQNAADAAALAAATTLLTDEAQRDDGNIVLLEGAVRGDSVAQRFVVEGQRISFSQANVTYGRLENSRDLSETFNTQTTAYNAVRVIVQRTATSADGPIAMTFARILGWNEAEVGAVAVAMLDDRMSAYKPRSSGRGPLTPFVIEENTYANQLVAGPDEYGFDEHNGTISYGPDGIPEVKLFPYKLSGNGKKDKNNDGFAPEEDEGNGNFGILNIGVNNNGTPAIEQQIIDGVTQEDLVKEIGTDEMVFYEDDGTPVTHVIGGTPGLKASLKDAFEARKGETIGFLLYRSPVQGNGANAEYTVVGIRFGRIMEVSLTGGDKKVVLQPTRYQGPEIVTNPDAPSTDLQASRLQLVR